MRCGDDVKDRGASFGPTATKDEMTFQLGVCACGNYRRNCSLLNLGSVVDLSAPSFTTKLECCVTAECDVYTSDIGKVTTYCLAAGQAGILDFTYTLL